MVSVSATPITHEMNADAAPNNESDDALVITMKEPTITHHGTPVIHLREDTTSVGFPREVLRRVIRQHLPELRVCSKADLGRVVVHFTIDPAGNVKNATSAAGVTVPSDVATCVTAAFGAMKFPEPQGGSVIVDYPVVFAP